MVKNSVLKFWGVWCTPPLSLLPGSLWSVVVVPLSVPSIGQIILFKHLSVRQQIIDIKLNCITEHYIKPFKSIQIRVAFNKFPDFFVQDFKIVVVSWKFTLSLLCILWDDWPIFMISGSKEQLQQELEYTLLKPDCHDWTTSKMQSGREDTLEERYAIKFCFKHGKKCHRNAWNASDCFWSILHESSISFWVA